MQKHILALSGGIHSTTLLYDLHKQNVVIKPIFFKGIENGDKNSEELVKYHCDKLNLSLQTIDISHTAYLTEERPFFEVILITYLYKYRQFIGDHGNVHHLTLGCGVERNNAFLFSNIFKALYPHVNYNTSLHIPYQRFSCSKIIELIQQLKVPLNLVWSCDISQYHNSPSCNKCEGCITVQKGIDEYKYRVGKIKVIQNIDPDYKEIPNEQVELQKKSKKSSKNDDKINLLKIEDDDFTSIFDDQINDQIEKQHIDINDFVKNEETSNGQNGNLS